MPSDQSSNNYLLEPQKEGDSALSTIKEVSEEYGLTLRALRFYEQRGLLSPIRHKATRYYNGEQKRRVQMIVKGRQLGFTLTEMQQFSENATPTKANMLGLNLSKKTILKQLQYLTERRAEIEMAIKELSAALSSDATAQRQS